MDEQNSEPILGCATTAVLSVSRINDLFSVLVILHEIVAYRTINIIHGAI